MTAQVHAPVLTAGTWTVSDSRTRVTFAVGNFGRSAHGSVACSWGMVEIGVDGVPTHVQAELDLNSIDTGIAKRDADLRKPHLLDIDRHPTMTWAADRFSRGDDGRWTAEGVLHVRGMSAPLTVAGTPEAVDATTIRVRASAVLDRRSVGIRAPGFLIGKIIGIEIDAWLTPSR